MIINNIYLHFDKGD